MLLLRHAKSSWEEPQLPDHLRPLAPRGKKAAPRIGSYMADEGLEPELVLCSPARRAVDTWSLVSEQFTNAPPVEILEDLYHNSPGTLLALIRELPDAVDSVLLVGHNPTFEELALSLSGGGDEEGLADMARKYPTGALAVIDFPAQRWREVDVGTGSLRLFARPKALSS
ncbi:MAG: histidine phosphatase family protein [Gemmatimonadota bacterium]